MEDDAVRERHGVSCRECTCDKTAAVLLIEGESDVFVEISKFDGARLTPWQARYLASKLYRISRRIRNRAGDDK